MTVEANQDWLRLDNAAKIYPAAASQDAPAVFRLSATFDTPIHIAALQQAYASVLARCPYFQVYLRRAVFWYYLQRHNQVPPIQLLDRSLLLEMPIRQRNAPLLRVQLILLSVTVSLLLWLALLDSVTTGGPWFLYLALPITVLAAALSSLMVLVARHVDISTLSVVALSLVAAGLLLLGVEATLHWFLTDRVFVSWSLLTFACIFPPVLLLFYLQHRLRRHGPEIRKRFHL